jgi:hypothetical protein
MQRPTGMKLFRRISTGARFRVLAVVAVLLMSQLAVACHQTAHFVPDRAECELCVSEAQTLCAPLPAVSTIPVVAQQHFVPQTTFAAFLNAACYSSYQSRAPPHQA